MSKKSIVNSKVNKSEFVRSMGDASAKDVIAAAKKQGFALSPAHVYAIRSKATSDAKKRSVVTSARAVERMARAAETPIESIVRRIVREEVRSLLGSIGGGE